MFYTVYKITNLINEKIYIGAHKTSNLSDDYMGSGKLIHKAIEKYGIENFKKEYIVIFDNAEEMFNRESELVNEEFVSRKDTYNLKQGGFGGFDFINSNGLNYLHDNRENSENNLKLGTYAFIEKLKDDNFYKIYCKKMSDSIKLYYENGGTNPFLNKKHTDETKRIIGEKNSEHQKGEGNSQYGTMWIHNLDLKQSKKISKEEEIPKGWLKGRKMKF